MRAPSHRFSRALWPAAFTAMFAVLSADASSSPGSDPRPDNPIGQPSWLAWPPLAELTTPITLVFYNCTSLSIELPSASPWWIEDRNGTAVYAPVQRVTDGATVPAEEAETWTWTQRDESGMPVPPGSYLAKIRWRFKLDDTWRVSATEVSIEEAQPWGPEPGPRPTASVMSLNHRATQSK